MQTTQFLADTGERIYRIPCDLHRTMESYAYLILGDTPTTLVDCGTGEGNCLPEILTGFEWIRSEFHESFEISEIRRIIVTHAHIDHGGGVPFFLKHADAEVMCHLFDASVITRYDERASLGNRRFADFLKTTGIDPEQQRTIIRAFGFTPGRTKAVSRVRPLADGEKLDNFTIHHTPGHSPGHICIQVGNSHVILGDHILSKTLTPTWPERVTPHSGLTHFMESVQNIRKRVGSMTGLPGHEQVIEHLTSRIEMVEKSHHRRLERVVSLLEKSPEPMNIAQIARKMYLSQSGNWALLALTDIGARMEYLEQHNLVSVVNAEMLEQEKEDVIYFRVV